MKGAAPIVDHSVMGTVRRFICDALYSLLFSEVPGTMNDVLSAWVKSKETLKETHAPDRPHDKEPEHYEQQND